MKAPVPVFTLELPEPTPSNNIVRGQHFRVYASTRKRWRQMVLAALDGRAPETPLPLARLEVDRFSVGSLDWDNALGGLKPLLDCLVMPSARNPDGLGLVLDDNPRAMPQAPRMRQLPAKRGAGKTVVRIFAVESEQ